MYVRGEIIICMSEGRYSYVCCGGDNHVYVRGEITI